MTIQTGVAMSTRLDVVADLNRRASVIADALKTAFGGASQVSPRDIGRAVAGNINNNGLTVHGTLEEVCVAVVDSFDGDGDYETTIPIWEVVGACREALDTIGVRYDALPHPVAATSSEVEY